MKVLWAIIGSIVIVLIFLGMKNMLAFQPNLFLILLLLISLSISLALWFFRKRLR
jgi:hypothetical protein